MTATAGNVIVGATWHSTVETLTDTKAFTAAGGVDSSDELGATGSVATSTPTIRTYLGDDAIVDATGDATFTSTSLGSAKADGSGFILDFTIGGAGVSVDATLAADGADVHRVRRLRDRRNARSRRS